MRRAKNYEAGMGGFKSQNEAYNLAKKLYRCKCCNDLSESPKQKKCKVCGQADFLKFDSSIEYKRYCELLLQQNCGIIRDLHQQVKFRLNVNGLLVTTYTADSVYRNSSGTLVVEDVKPDSKKDKAISKLFWIKARLFEVIHGFKISIERR